MSNIIRMRRTSSSVCGPGHIFVSSCARCNDFCCSVFFLNIFCCLIQNSARVAVSQSLESRGEAPFLFLLLSLDVEKDGLEGQRGAREESWELRDSECSISRRASRVVFRYFFKFLFPF